MRSGCAVLLTLAQVACGAIALAGEMSKEQLARFDLDHDGNVDPDKMEIYSAHLYDETNILVLYDDNLDGRIDGDEVARINADVARPNHGTAEARLKSRMNVPVPLSGTPDSIASATGEDVSRFYLREQRLDLGIDGDATGLDATSGAAISIVNDIEGGASSVSVAAAIGYLFRHYLQLPDGYEPGQLAVSAVSFGPYVEANGQVDSSTSQLSFGAMGQLDLFSGVFNLQRLSFAPYYQTDFKGESQIYGATATWQPLLLKAGLGSLRRSPSDLFDYTWAFAGQTDYRHVAEAGATGLVEDDDYFWVGADTTFRIWPLPERLDNRLFLTVQAANYYDLEDGDSANKYTAEIGLALDDTGNVTFNLQYVNGTDYRTMLDEEAVGTTFKVRF